MQALLAGAAVEPKVLKLRTWHDLPEGAATASQDLPYGRGSKDVYYLNWVSTTFEVHVIGHGVSTCWLQRSTNCLHRFMFGSNPPAALRLQDRYKTATLLLETQGRGNLLSALLVILSACVVAFCALLLCTAASIPLCRRGALRQSRQLRVEDGRCGFFGVDTDAIS
jgi:hypothetical protein